MEVLTLICVIIILLLLFVVGGLLGWVLKGVEEIFSFLSRGCGTTIIWIIGITVLIALIFG